MQGLRAGAGNLGTPTCRRGHRQYLSGGPLYDFPRYRSTVHEVNQVFAAASRGAGAGGGRASRTPSAAAAREPRAQPAAAGGDA